MGNRVCYREYDLFSQLIDNCKDLNDAKILSCLLTRLHEFGGMFERDKYIELDDKIHSKCVELGSISGYY